MLTKVTFEPLKGRRYRVRKNGAFVIRDGKPLIVNEAGIAATRNSLMNEGRKPPPPLVPFKRPEPVGRIAYGKYDTYWKETTFYCPWCLYFHTRHRHFSGQTSCAWCDKPFTVLTAEAAEPTPANNIDEVEALA